MRQEIARRKWTEVEALSDRARQIDPNDPQCLEQRSELYQQKNKLIIEVCELVPDSVTICEDGTPDMVQVKLHGNAGRHFPKDRRAELDEVLVAQLLG